MVAKPCTKCGDVKPPSEFYRVKQTGAIRSQCKACDRERMARWQRENPDKRMTTYRKWKADNPERYDAQQRAARARRDADPERFALKKDQNREHWRRKHNVPPERYRVGVEPEGMVDVAPIREAVERAGLSNSEVAGRMGVDEAAIRKGLKQDSMSVEKALRILDAIDVLPLEVGL